MEGLSERDKAVLKSIFDPTATVGEVVDDEDKFEDNDEEPSTDGEKRSVELCIRGVQLAEAGNLTDSLKLLTEAIEEAPNRASVYNDRAQLYRLMEKDDAAMLDIERALSLTVGKKSRARAQALCQRGLLLRKKGTNDEARVAFAEAANMGSGFARKQVVELNPYAALCNQMLSQVMKGEKEIKL